MRIILTKFLTKKYEDFEKIDFEELCGWSLWPNYFVLFRGKSFLWQNIQGWDPGTLYAILTCFATWGVIDLLRSQVRFTFLTQANVHL